MKAWTKGIILAICLLLVGLLAGCGGNQQKDPNQVKVFIMGTEGFPQEMAQQIQQKIQQKLGSSLTVTVSTTPVYSPEKLVLEYVDHMDDIIILPENDMKSYAASGGHLVLDQDFDAKTYAKGVTKGAANEEDTDPAKQKEHLFAIPVNQMAVFKEIGYTKDDLYATIPLFANHDNAVKVLKAMIE
ncbi:hypothetical protein [Paenibacillus wulumuqiensis]|uniref:hypothetical protein n=1 Tax=Paenibacillus wulumuqiensis TaxID=1567107 RepID=UPI0006197B24|nr:hypothetical protein [Paenibacillus wulumuqiensis]